MRPWTPVILYIVFVGAILLWVNWSEDRPKREQAAHRQTIQDCRVDLGKAGRNPEDIDRICGR